VATRRFSRALSLAIASALGIATIALVPSTGSADPNVSIEEVQQRVDDLYHQGEEATERAHDITLQVHAAQRSLARLRADIRQQEREFEGLREVLADAAAEMYATGGIDPSMQMMLSSDPDDFLLQAQSLDQVLRSQDADLRRAQVAQLELARDKARADQELAELRDLQAEAQKERDAANAKLAQAEQLLSRLKAEERERLAAIQERRAAQAAAAARSESSSTPSSSSPPAPTSSGSGRGSTAVAFANAQVGKAYVFGASGPNAYDCSGLTSAAWAQAGVSLPHSASAQYGVTSRVDAGSLQPGDLLFFYSGISHVGMYVGGGMMVHASNPSTGVERVPLAGYWMSVFVGGGRV
jgi:cell wall-associated NlpC family hydrolase